MESFISYIKNLQNFSNGFWRSTCFFICYCISFFRSTCLFVSCCYRDLLLRINPFFLQFFYFVFLSFVGFGILKVLKPRTEFKPRNLDLFFTSVSSITVSSMSTVEMEIFSNAQLIVMTFLMFVGGEAFTSMVGLHLKRCKIIRTWKSAGKVTSVESDIPTSSPPPNDIILDHIELSGIVTIPESGIPRFESHNNVFTSFNPFIKYDSIKFLGFVVLGYVVVIHVLGIASVLLYISIVQSAKDVLKNKGLKTFTFAIFTTVSTFASCGFVPTNENMMVFGKNSGLLLILIPQVLLGNTLFPPFLRFFIWVVGKKFKKEEAEYLLKNSTEIGYLHFLPAQHSLLLVATVLGFIFTGFILFCAMEWNSASLNGLNAYQKIVGAIFQCVNARHTGETIVDLSTIAAAVLVFFVVLMYLPPYTSFLPIKKDEINPQEYCDHDWEVALKKRRRRSVADNFIFSQLSYLVFFIILISITERKSIQKDPINFSLFNIILEVVSAYGNVGFTTGYSCERELRADPNCVDKWYGFCGKWSDEGKVILILVMFFGRLKKFNMNGGKGWKLL